MWLNRATPLENISLRPNICSHFLVQQNKLNEVALELQRVSVQNFPIFTMPKIVTQDVSLMPVLMVNLYIYD